MKKLEKLKNDLRTFGIFLLSSGFVASLALLTYWALTQSALAVVSVSVLFSVLSIAISITNLILFGAKSLSTHSVQILDIKSGKVSSALKNAKINKQEDPLLETEEEEIERMSEEKARTLTNALFGGPKEKMDDSIVL